MWYKATARIEHAVWKMRGGVYPAASELTAEKQQNIKNVVAEFCEVLQKEEDEMPEADWIARNNEDHLICGIALYLSTSTEKDNTANVAHLIKAGASTLGIIPKPEAWVKSACEIAR